MTLQWVYKPIDGQKKFQETIPIPLQELEWAYNPALRTCKKFPLRVWYPGMHSNELRHKFLAFFQKKGHALVPSSPVIPHDDPTLLFINAGMNQFKDVFLGKSARDYQRAASSQKCIRVGGKHNDLENVGHTSRHLTFFEMLGNFSFGDYFKKEAIAFAWEAALSVFGFDPHLIWATVYYEDEESFALWKEYMPEKRIVRMGAKDNFWAMGDTGPCGPCSELLFDRGNSFGPARSPSEDVEGERYLEFWNLVFMEFNRDVLGELHPLPKQCVDTGAGLERVISLSIGVSSLFETDILRALIAKVEDLAQTSYHPSRPNAPAFRVIADHVRSLAFAIADGVQPSNLDRGYVLRKILRRAVRYGRQLGFERPFLAEVFPCLVDAMGGAYPELEQASGRICELLDREEEHFLRTLRRGGSLMSQIIEASRESGEISGDHAFSLKDTYGFPLEEILLLAKDAGLSVDLNRFEDLEHAARTRSRGARKEEAVLAGVSPFEAFAGLTTFLGHQQLSADAVLIGIWKGSEPVPSLHEGEEGTVILDKTPFYAEKGGQVGDQGAIMNEASSFLVADCRSPFTEVIVHHGILKQGELRVGDRVSALVDAPRRQKIANNHTATHLLHWALQKTLGPHIRQAGSLVEPKRLRFDFSHHKPLTKNEIREIESLINTKIRENQPVRVYELPYGEAQAIPGIKQFFGEKYGSVVRVIDIDYSKELCGGTHTPFVGTIGYFRISKEGSIAAGVRRIEAQTGEDAELLAWEKEDQAAEKAQEEVNRLKEENERMKKDLERLHMEKLRALVKQFHAPQPLNGIPFLAEVVFLEPKELKLCADILLETSDSLALLLISRMHGQCTFLARVTPDLVQRGIRADALIREIASHLGGKGGGKADSAQGGGTRLEKIPEAIELAKAWISKTLGS